MCYLPETAKNGKTLRTKITLILDLRRNCIFFFPSSVVWFPEPLVPFPVSFSRSDLAVCFWELYLIPVSGGDCAVPLAESLWFEPGSPSDSLLAVFEMNFSWLAAVFRKPLESPEPFFILSNYNNMQQAK